jgi:hypothetical protein
MAGPQTQHKGTVYGDDENAPKPGLFLFFLGRFAPHARHDGAR